VQGFTNVSNLCFDVLSLEYYTSIAFANGSVYWAGYPGYLNQSGTDLTSFTLAGSGQVGFSVFNTIFAGDEVTTWGHD